MDLDPISHFSNEYRLNRESFYFETRALKFGLISSMKLTYEKI